MYIKYGSYQHLDAECSVVIDKTPVYSDRGKLDYTRETWTISGELQASSQAALTTAINALQTAYGSNGHDLGLYLDNGTATSHILPSGRCLGGTRITRFSFPQGRGAEYATFRNYQITVEGDFRSQNQLQAGGGGGAVNSDNLLEWEESLTFMGGGPRFGFLIPLNGLPQKQLLSQATPYSAVQAGRAVGSITWPLPSAPLWPDAEHVDERRIDKRGPKRLNTLLRGYEIVWQYNFESAVPLIGNPRSL